jgi:hypothetical protein
MKVTVIGPNLPDQTKGSFHVHKAGCRDAVRLIREMKGYVHDVDVESRQGIVLWVYSDHMGDNEADDSEWRGWDDFYLAPCVDLPDEDPALRPWAVRIPEEHVVCIVVDAMNEDDAKRVAYDRYKNDAFDFDAALYTGHAPRSEWQVSPDGWSLDDPPTD